MARRSLRYLADGATRNLNLKPGIESVEVQAIQKRQDEDTRALSAAAVIGLAESIAVLGLLEPIVVEPTGHLLAGGHRLAALRLLALKDPRARREAFLSHVIEGEDTTAAEFGEVEDLAERLDLIDATAFLKSHPKGKIPVHIIDVRRSQDGGAGKALAVEAAENTARRPYSPTEIRELASRLKKAGLRMAPGKPKKGQRSALTALEAAVGLSRRQIQRLLNRKAGERPLSGWELAKAALRRSAERVMNESANQNSAEAKKIVTQARTLLGLLRSDKKM